MRRSCSTSSWEYRRVPFGERLRLDQPARLVHAQRLRVHVRQLGGDRDHEHAAARSRPRCARLSDAHRDRRAIVLRPIAVRCAAPAPSNSRARGFGAVDRLRERVDRLRLLLVELLRHVDHEAVVDVPALRRLPAPELRRALAAQALDGAVLGPRRHAQGLGAVQGRHLHLGAAQRLGDRQRHLDLEVVALALEDRRGRDVRDQIQVAGRPAAAARARPCRRDGCGCRRAHRRGCSRAGA